MKPSLLQPLANRSIAIRLAVSALFWSFTILLVAGAILVALYRDATERAFDRRMLVYVTALAADLAAGPEQGRPDAGDPYFDLPLSGWYWQISSPGQALRDISTSFSLIGATLPPLGEDAQVDPETGVRRGYARGPDDQELRVIERAIDLGEGGVQIITVAGPSEEIAYDVRSFSIALSATFGLLGLALALSTLLQIRFGLRPLRGLRGALVGVRRGEADRIEGEYPHDIAPIADEINLLISSNREILERARTQVGNLAHALKTPLSVIVNEAEVANGPLAASVSEQTRVMREQIDYYLDRARAAALAGTLGSITPVAPVAESFARTLPKIYRDKDLEIVLRGMEGARFRGEKQDLEEMLGNLLDNAAKWTSGRVVLEARAGGDAEAPRLLLVVSDDGPGVPDAQARKRIVERGRRLDESMPGSGLGLSIVADLAALYRGSLRLEKAAIGGLEAILDLPGDAA
ncbi:MAG: sensor histidine kinase [Salinarimonadaceae bacterium]|nr:MAG: sensor histidine kinase [Salinarimonadaceae bacterium]